MSLVFHEDLKWSHAVPTLITGGEVTLHTLVEHPDKVVTAYHPGKEPEELEWWVEHVSECLAGVNGVVKCHGLVRTAPDGPIFGVMWQRAPGKLAHDNMPKGVHERVTFALRCVEVLIAMMARGLIYSDIKTNNLFRDDDNSPWFIDLLSCSSACDLEYPDGDIKPRQFEMGYPYYVAPEFTVPGAAHVNTPATLAHSTLVLVWLILKDDYPFDLLNEYGVKVPWGEIKGNGYYGQFTAGTLPTRLTPLDNGVPYAEVYELLRWVFELGFVQGRLAPQVRPSMFQIRDALKSWDDALTQQRKEKAMKKKVMWGGGVLTTLAAVFLAAMFVLPLPKKKAQSSPAPEPQAVTPLLAPVQHGAQVKQPPQVRDDNRPNLWRGIWLED